MTVTVGWVAYVLAVSALLSTAARAGEAALRLRRRAVRWVWTAGLVATATVPLAPRLLPLLAGAGTVGDGPAAGGDGAGAGLLAGGVSTASASGPGGDALAALVDVLATPVPDGLALGLGVAWAAATAVLLATLAGGWIRLRRRCRAWPEERAGGTSVRVSRGTGPAAAGVLRPVVVVPAWLLRRGGPDLEMAVLHERQHARARDPALLAAGRALAALVPWNPFLWWQLRRLRLAVELDCDRRVLEAGFPRRAYGRLLLDVSASPSGGLLRPAATLSERPTHLEERIRAMTSDPSPRFAAFRALVLAGLALGLVAVACETPPPPSPADGGAEAPEAAADRGARGVAGEASDALDLDREPEIADRERVLGLVKSHYPPVLRDQGVGGTVSLRLRVGPDGSVERSRVLESSGHPGLDEAAREAAASMEFEPARKDGGPVAAWVTQRVSFLAGDVDRDTPSPFAARPGDGDAEPAQVSGVVVEGEAATARLEPGAERVRISGTSGDERRRTEILTGKLRVRGPAASGGEAAGDGPDMSTVRIRGDDAVDAADRPLIIVDGERVSTGGDWRLGDESAPSGLRDLAPEDIASIEVLKGEPAVDAYGEEAAAGVLLITTKQGAAGSG